MYGAGLLGEIDGLNINTISSSEAEELHCLNKYEFFNSRKTAKRLRILNNLYNDKINTWDYQWDFTVRTNSGLAIRPNVNLVENMGHGHPDAIIHFSNKKSLIRHL